VEWTVWTQGTPVSASGRGTGCAVAQIVEGVDGTSPACVGHDGLPCGAGREGVQGVFVVRAIGAVPVQRGPDGATRRAPRGCLDEIPPCVAIVRTVPGPSSR
jgi:hypothetical protein